MAHVKSHETISTKNKTLAKIRAFAEEILQIANES